jgi:palmitoyltransferase ZDHHC1/11
MQCNRCTLGFDHHCKFLNNCIGKKNYSLFFILIVLIGFFEVFVASTIFISFKQKGYNIQAKDILTLVLLVKNTVVFLADIYLIGFHVYLKIKHLTTFEFITGKRHRRMRGLPVQTDAGYKVNDESSEVSKIYPLSK